MAVVGGDDEFKKEMEEKDREAREIEKEKAAQQKVLDDITSKLHREPDPVKKSKLRDLLKKSKAKHGK